MAAKLSQQEIVARMLKMKWTRMGYMINDSLPDQVAVIMKAPGNVAVVYPNSVDRLQAGQGSLSPKLGWYDPVAKARNEARAKAALDQFWKLCEQILQNPERYI